MFNGIRNDINAHVIGIRERVESGGLHGKVVLRVHFVDYIYSIKVILINIILT
jgi:hypothetical protein